MSHGVGGAYHRRVPKLWSDTIEAHRRGVREAILDTTAALVTEHGLRSVTMSQIAERAGIGRATLYKYFPDVDAIMFAWHDRQIGNHLGYLARIRDQTAEPGERLEAVLRAYAVINQQTRKHHSTELGAFLHHDERLVHAQHQLHGLVRDLIAEAVSAGDLRDDVAPDELATYCLHALSAAGSLPSAAAIRRLVTVTLAGLRRPR
jgi:AcrR family transcriptional regulator